MGDECSTIVGVDEIDVNIAIKIYPNPTTDYLNVYYPNILTKQEITFSVVDMQGRVFKSYRRADTSNEIYLLPVYNLSTGVYILEIRQNDKTIAFRQFIKR